MKCHLQGTCTPLTLVRALAGYLHTPNTGQGTCTPLTLVRAPAGYLHTPNTSQDTKEQYSVVGCESSLCSHRQISQKRI